MKTIVIFPIADLRRFVGAEQMYLNRPSWALPERNRDFVRALGGIKETRECGVSLKGLDGWVVEPFVCDAKQGPKFHDMPAMACNGKYVQWKVDKRLLFFDGMCSARVEYHFSCDLSKFDAEVDFNTINDYLCNLRIKLRRHEGEELHTFDEVDFGRSGLLHAKALAARTVPSARFVDLHTIRRHIKFMRPAILHVIDCDEPLETGPEFTKVNSSITRYLEVLHDRVRVFSNIDVPVWVVRKKPKHNERDLRDLCLYLRRLHSEYECIKKLLLEVERGGVEVIDGFLPQGFEEYLREVLKRVRAAEKRLTREGKFSPDHSHDGAGMVELASVSIHDLDPSLHAQLRIALSRAKFSWTSNEKQVKSFAETWQARSAVTNFYVRELNVDNRQSVSNSTGVVLTQAGRDAQVKIDKSFNGFQENTSNTELVQSIADLKELLDQAIEAGEVEKPDALSRDFGELADEAASSEPRKEKIEFSGKMILGAIKESSGLITAVSKAIETLKGFF
ncbi:hypothetical protein [Tropicibacter sp. S64]|uniref:hypothetical protein n=1 Tax=Tropicibacter sp. S64 TaxID=3415122 RepID=UPI003C7CCDAF